MSTTNSKDNLYGNGSQVTLNDVEVSIQKNNRQVSKLLSCSLLLCILVIIGLLAGIIVVAIRKYDVDDGKPAPLPQIKPVQGECTTVDCVRAAAKMSNSINPTADPCEDFYEFACGNWDKKNVLTEDQSRTGTFNILSDEGDIVLKSILEKKSDAWTMPAVKKALDTYQSCTNEEALENIGINDAIISLEQLGGWPVLGNKPGGNWDQTNFNLMELLLKARRYTNSPPIFDSYVSDDAKDITKYIFYLDQPVLGMPNRKYYLKPRNDSVIMAYENYAVQLAIALGAEEATAVQDIKEIIDFEIQIANMSTPPDQRRDENKMYNKKTIRQLNIDYSQFNWTMYLTTIFAFEDVDITITDSEPIIVRNLEYMDKIFDFVDNYPNKERVIANFAGWRRIQGLAGALPKSIRDEYQKYRQALTGAKNARPRWKSCVSTANGRFGLAVGQLFIKEAFDDSAKKIALNMIENLRFSMKNILRNNDWMDDVTKKRAIEKADAIEPRIGYPNIVTDNAKLNEKYENLTVHIGAYLNNSLNNLYVGVGKNLRKLREPVDREKWSMEPAEVNAYYDPSKNQITFPAGILQPPFFHKNFPQYLNYGGIGYVIGHEITHGFDDQGRLYDKTGLLNQWWTNNSSENFKEKAQCIIDQYGNFTVKEAGLNLNGILTQGENIADNGGIKESFDAYTKWLNDKNGGKEEQRLPGLDYTPKQLYFLNSANVWCGIIRPAEARKRIYSDPHSNGKSRVNGPMQNYHEFAKAFNCRKGSYMNPHKKCSVW